MTKKSKLVKECMVISLSMALAAQVVPVGFSIFANEENPETVLPSTAVDKTESEETTEVETEDTDVDAGMNMDVDTEVSGMLIGILDDLTNGIDVDKAGIKEMVENIRYLASQYPEGSFSQATLDKLAQAELLVQDNTTTDGADKGDGEAGGNTGTADLTVPFDYSDEKWKNLSLMDAKRVEEERAWLEAHKGSLSAEEYSKLDTELTQAEDMIDGLKQSLITERYEGIGEKVEEATIKAGMTQDAVNDVLSTHEVVYVEPGDYGLGDTTHIKLIVKNDDQVINMESGEYTRLTIINEGSNTVVNAENVTVDGQVSEVGNQSPFIYVPTGSLTLYGNLEVTDHDYGVIVGYTNGKEGDYAEFTLAEGATLNVKDCVRDKTGVNYEGSIVYNDSIYYTDLQGQGDGAAASALSTRGKGQVVFNFEDGSNFVATGCEGAGLFLMTANVTVNIHSAEAHFDKNYQAIVSNDPSWLPSKFIMNIDNSVVTFNENEYNAIVMSKNNDYLLNIMNGSEVSASRNGNEGTLNISLRVEDSTFNANGNKDSGGSRGAGLTAINSTLSFCDNAFDGIGVTRLNPGETSTRIDNSTILANNNVGPGIRLYVADKNTYITNSHIEADNNGFGENGYDSSPDDARYYSGIISRGSVYVNDSTVLSDGSVAAYSLYSTTDSLAPTLNIQGTDVVVLNGSTQKMNFDLLDYQGTNKLSGRTYVIGGSLQASIKKIHGQYNKWNEALLDENEQYSGPINSQGTKLVRFNLNKEVNKVVNNDDVNSFTYYDPNTNEKVDYTFRYNELGEDLNEGESDNAYVWAPVSIVNYNATQGKIANKGTAGTELALGSSVATGDPSGQQTATDITIYGNSLALAEKQLPSASRSGYTFSGWYVVDEGKEAEAEALAAAGNYTELYKLLNTRFNVNSKVATDLTSEENAQSEITVYAKWSVYDPSRPDPTPDPEPKPDPTEPSDPDTEIPDEETPETGGDKPNEPGLEETIDEEQTPEAGNKDEVPNTGVKSTLPWVAAFILSAAAIVAELLRKRKA